MTMGNIKRISINSFVDLILWERCGIIRSLRSLGGARGVMVIVVGIGHDDTSSNPGRE